MWFSSKRKFVQPKKLPIIIVKVKDITVNFKFNVSGVNIHNEVERFYGAAYRDVWHPEHIEKNDARIMLNCFLTESFKRGYFVFGNKQFSCSQYLGSEIIEETEREIIVE